MKTPSTSIDQIAAKEHNKQAPIWSRPGLFIGVLIVIYLVVGFFVVTQYGESIDEPPRMAYADQSLQAYAGGSQSLQDEKGPFYGMLARLGSQVLAVLVHGWKTLDGWHYMSFIAFVMGIYFFYRLCRRLVDPAPAIAVTLLFSTQPILVGHAFINPKDIPFMTFFLASLCLGLEMVDTWQAQALSSGEPPTLKSEVVALRKQLPDEWATASRRLRWLVVGLGMFLAALLLSFPLVRILIAWVVTQFYAAPPSSFLGRLFRRAAENASSVPVLAYIHKAQTVYGYLALALGVVLLLALIWTMVRVFHSLGVWSLQPRLLLAGFFLGCASDIRTLGPASGLLVALYFLYKGRRKAIPYVLEYLTSGALVIYVFWPNLWKNPLGGYLTSLSEASDFPFNGSILFVGNSYSHGRLPFYYLPALFGLQFTETALVLILVGILLALVYLVKRPSLRMDLLLVGAWLIGPIAAAIVLHSTIYNNFRQFLFVVPALFFFAGLALQVIWNCLKGRRLIYILVGLLILLPGLYWDWQLHPYQYMYYNSLAGGVAGASTSYDMDYWFITYKEGMQYVNQVAPGNSVVYFWNTDVTALPYARPDLKLTMDESLEGIQSTQPIYAVIATRYPGTQFIFGRSKVVYQIRRGGAVLAVVKQVNIGDYIQDK